jgi:hypothetical protein
MLFPFKTLQVVLKIFGDPDNQALRRHWMAIHSFYSHVNGPSDLPTFAAVIERFQGRAVTRKAIEDWARVRYQPSINPERGLGIQPFGERVSLHQAVIDEFKRKLFTDDTPRETIAEALRFRNLLAGWNHENPRIKGLAQRIEGAKSQDYYSAALQAIGLGASGWEENLSRVNMFAGSLTSLAEQTALMTKTSVLVQKSRPTTAEVPAGLRLYFEPGTEKYLLALAEAADQMILADISDRECMALPSNVPQAETIASGCDLSPKPRGATAGIRVAVFDGKRFNLCDRRSLRVTKKRL